MPSEERVDEGGNGLKKRLLIMCVVLVVALVAALPAVAQVTRPDAVATDGSAVQANVASSRFAAQAEYCRGGPDTDGDGIPNRCDPDADGDDIQNGADNDIDGDGDN